ncbi:recombinase family protein [Williamsia muralis]|uniref:Recombinase family protein n=1 Tax=Williamsia marianensis TaxID=85044 RepID=A0ABU4F0J0_WILMA|nr:recombinase family protein [Williamsia muralis]MDV7137017.1 recombinase family protein [Williamsia muralis]
MRAAVYLRQSLDRHNDGLAVARQREDCLELCAQRGWGVTEYEDNDTSATKGRRPRYEAMLEDIRAGSVDAVVVWDLDRLHRRPAELELFIDLAESRKIALATVGGDADLSTDNGRLFARIKGAVGAAEGERKAARQRAAAKQRATAGKAWGPRAFGYTEGNAALVDIEAEAVRDAYSKVLAGASLGSIATEWNKAGIATTKGNAWRSAQVRQMLINARYAGLRAYNGDIVGPAQWPAIVTEDVWRSVQNILADPARRRGPTRGRKHVLTGLGVCGQCGALVGSGIASSTGAAVYRCKSCFKISRGVATVDEYVSAVVVERLSRPDAAELTIDHHRVDIGELRDEAAVLRTRLDDLGAAFADGEIDRSQMATATAKIRTALAAVENRMTDAHRARVFDGTTGMSAVAFGGLSLDRRRAIIDALMTITIEPAGRGRGFRPETVTIEWRTDRA